MRPDTDSIDTNTAQLLAAGSALADGKHFDINDTPAILIPNGYRVELFEEHRDAPLRIQQTIRTTTAEAFVAYLKRYGDTATVVFADCDAHRFQAVLDYHDPLPSLLPAWCRHRVIYPCPHSKEWETWMERSGAAMGQGEFAEFIEDNLIDIVEPAGAEVLEVASSLQARTSVRFKSALRLDNGETQLLYQEVIDGAAGAKGQLKIPQTIKLALRVFQGEDPYAVEAGFKFRIKEGHLSLIYELIRPHRIVEDSFNAVMGRLRDQLDDIPVLAASAPPF